MIGPDTIVVGLGGNVGGDDAVVARMRQVAEAFAPWGRVRASPVYRTAPVGGPPQPDYLNAALAIHADPAPMPRELIETVHEIERLCGRTRETEVRWGPRPIDLDVLLWGARIVDIGGLRVPHERLAVRRFALAPLIDLVGDEVVIPGDGRTLRVCWDTLSDQRTELTGLVFAEG